MTDETERFKIKNIVSQLEAFGHRGSATRNEKLAAEYLQEQLESRNIASKLVSFRGQSSYGTRILVHLVLGLVGLGLLVWSPAASFVVSFLSLVSFLLETSAFPYGFSRMFSTSSQNVVGQIPSAKQPRRRIVLCAHYDTQRTGWIWNTNRIRSFTSTFGRAPGPLKAPLFLVTFVLTSQVALALLGTQSATAASPNLLVYGFVLFYALSMVLVGQWSIGQFVPGANDNASGVACAIEVATRWERVAHNETELVVLLSGCEESGSVGAALWARQHAKDLSKVPTVFLNLDTLGCRQLHFLKHECALNGFIFNYPEQLLDLCHSIAEEMGLDFTDPHPIPTQTDGLAFLVRGVPGITLISSETGSFVPNYHLMSDRSENLDFAAIARATEFAWMILLNLDRAELPTK